jgi:glycosyltransferase involved in cell wall biosynthesis
VVRRSWGIDDRRQLVGYLGRIAEDKNPLAVCQAVGVLEEDYQAVIAGTGPSLAQHQKQAAGLCGDRVRFVPPLAHVGDALAAIDCWLNASPAEGNCLGLIEAWMAGVPVVSTITGAIPEHEAAAGCQLVERVPNPPTPADLAEAVRRACSSSGRRRAVAAQIFALEHLGAERMAREFERMIEKVMSDK